MNTGGISAGMRLSNFFGRIANVAAAVALSVKSVAARVLVDESKDEREIEKMNRRMRRAYRSRFRSAWRGNIFGSKLQRKAAQHKLCGRTTRLIQRFVRLQQERILARLRAEVAAGRVV